MIQMGVAVALAAAMMSGGLPDGMLFMESHPPAKEWETYKETDSRNLPLQLNPCFHRSRRDGGRLTTRAVLYAGDGYESKYEQLVVYKDVEHAKRAMNLLRADLRKCADVGKGWERYRYFSRPLDVGDEGLRAGGRFFENGEHAVAVRRGAAVYLVGESAWPTKSLPIQRFRDLIAQAETMTVRVCELPEASC
ncbi:hypothetical protein ETD86_22285 [Nonomuraea turkmeniaca]|uniref:Sensor domain-containing protein n=1 Tax=Nonomuraea turkmeniaca TaxID=103838 RepID=A0A5S4G0L1_9ACTN|nr:hypothetical protein [Nonomuraea turkmeniaca]TMR18047.1 hypothetical protein ETD86_22285 [Nonomuraea turkmeniaca]